MPTGTAWIIGATGALGSATARTFHAAGWDLGLAARSESNLLSLQAELTGGGAPTGVQIAQLDASDPARVQAALSTLAGSTGIPDVCLHLAGGYAGGRDVHQWSVEEWRGMMDLNLLGPVWTLTWVFGELVRSGRRGTLVAVGAVAALEASGGKAPYAVSKAGVIHLIRLLAAEGKSRGIRANAVVPTILDTSANRRAMPNADTSQWTPVDDAARVLLWLSSKEASPVSGALLPL